MPEEEVPEIPDRPDDVQKFPMRVKIRRLKAQIEIEIPVDLGSENVTGDADFNNLDEETQIRNFVYWAIQNLGTHDKGKIAIDESVKKFWRWKMEGHTAANEYPDWGYLDGGPF
jgi:hypothetical protein